MAIAYDTFTSGNYRGAGLSPNTYSHTCTGSDRILFVQTYSGGSNVTGVTYNGVAMTQLVSVGGDKYKIWYLLGPATGSNTVSITYTSNDCGSCSASYTGVDQGQTPQGGSDVTAPASAHQLSFTTSVDGCWSAGWCGLQRHPSAGTDTTERGTWSTNPDGNWFDTNGTQSTAGTQNLNTTFSSISGQYTIGANFEPVGASIGTNFQVNIGDAWKTVDAMKINIGDTWKDVAAVKINIGDTWRDVF